MFRNREIPLPTVRLSGEWFNSARAVGHSRVESSTAGKSKRATDKRACLVPLSVAFHCQDGLGLVSYIFLGKGNYIGKLLFASLFAFINDHTIFFFASIYQLIFFICFERYDF